MWTKFSIYETFFPATVFKNVAKLKSFTTNVSQHTHTHTHTHPIFETS